MAAGISTIGMTRDRWLDERRKGIGSSDAAAICAKNPWRSRFSVWADKTVEITTDDTMRLRLGRDMEPFLATWFTEQTGQQVRQRHAILRHNDHPWMLANLDRTITSVDGRGPGVLELKTEESSRPSHWHAEAPDAYALQVQHQFAVTGYQWGYIAVLRGFGNTEFIVQEVERDDELIKQLIEVESHFWYDHVVPKNPPPIDGYDSTTEAINRMFGHDTNPEVLELPGRAREIIEELDVHRLTASAVDGHVTRLRNELKMMMGEHETGYVAGRKVSWKPIRRRAYEVAETTYRQLSIGQPQGESNGNEDAE